MRTLLLALWLSLTPIALGATAPTIILAADAWCPYNCEPESDRPGYVIELAQAVFGRAGYRVEYRRMPWARTLKSVMQGEIQGAIGATREELPEARFPAEPVGIFQGHFIVQREQRWHYRDEASLEGIRLGVINSYDYGDFNGVIDRRRDSAGLQVLSGEDPIARGLAMLVRGRLDAYLEDRNVALYNARRLGFAESVRAGEAVGAPIPLYIAFSHRDPAAAEYARLLTEGIRALRASGELAEILGRYGVADWSKASTSDRNDPGHP